MKKNTYEVVIIANEDVYAIFKNDFLFMKFAEGIEAKEAHEVCERLTKRAVDCLWRVWAWVLYIILLLVVVGSAVVIDGN